MRVEGKSSNFDLPARGNWRVVTSLLIEEGKLFAQWANMVEDIDTREKTHTLIETIHSLITQLQMYAQPMLFPTTCRRHIKDLDLLLMESKKWLKALREQGEGMRMEDLKVGLKYILDFLGRNFGRIVEAILDVKLQYNF